MQEYPTGCGDSGNIKEYGQAAPSPCKQIIDFKEFHTGYKVAWEPFPLEPSLHEEQHNNLRVISWDRRQPHTDSQQYRLHFYLHELILDLFGFLVFEIQFVAVQIFPLLAP